MSAQASMSLGFIDSTLEQILERPGLWGPLPSVELQILRLLEVRFVLRGGDPKDCGEITNAFLEYLSAHFPHSPPCSLWGRITAVPGLDEARHEPYFRELLSDFIAAVQRRQDAIVVPTTGPRKPEYMPHDTIGRLGYLIEECAEVGHICGKILRFGFDNFHPDVPVEKRKTNAELLLHEIGNASFAIDLMYQQLGARPSVESSASDREDYDQCDARDGEHFCQLTRGHYPATKHADPSDDLKTVHEWDDPAPREVMVPKDVLRELREHLRPIELSKPQTRVIGDVRAWQLSSLCVMLIGFLDEAPSGYVPHPSGTAPSNLLDVRAALDELADFCRRKSSPPGFVDSSIAIAIGCLRDALRHPSGAEAPLRAVLEAVRDDAYTLGIGEECSEHDGILGDEPDCPKCVLALRIDAALAASPPDGVRAAAGTTEPTSLAVAEVTPKPRERCPACDLAYPVVFGDRWRCEECGSFGDVVAPASDPVVLGTPTQLDRDKLRDEIARVQSVANAKSPALLDALSRAALMECERAIQQARRFWETGERTSQEGGWETFFRTIFERVLREHQSALQEVLARVVREMRTAVSIVRERTPLIKNQMEAANAVERWANEIARSLG